MQPNSPNEPMGTLGNEETPLKKELLTLEASPLQASQKKETPRPKNKDTSILMSNENLKVIYERKKEMKAREPSNLLGDKTYSSGLVQLVVTSDDKYFLFSPYYSQRIHVFDLETKQEVHCFETAHSQTISSRVPITLTSNNRFIISRSEAKESISVKVFDLQTKEEVYHFQEAEKGKDKYKDRYKERSKNRYKDKYEMPQDSQMQKIPRRAPPIITSESKSIVVDSSGKSIEIFDLQTKQQVHQFPTKDWITSMVITSDNRFLIAVSHDKSIQVFDLEAKQEFHHFENAHEGEKIPSVTVTPNNRFIILQAEDFKVFDLQMKQEVYRVQKNYDDPRLVFTSNNKFIVTDFREKSIDIFDFQTKQQVHQFPNKNLSSSMVLTSNERFLIFASGGDKSLQVFDLETKQELHYFKNNVYKIHYSEALLSNNRFIVGFCDKSIKIFDLETQKEVVHIQNAHQDEISKVNVTYDNRFIVSHSKESTKVFDFETKQEVHHFEKIDSLAVTSNNRFMISYSQSGLKIFDLENEQEEVHHPQKAMGYQTSGFLNSLVVTPNNKYIFCDFAFSMKVFDFQTKQLVHNFQKEILGNYGEEEYPDTVYSVTSDSRFIVFSHGFEDQSLQVFDLETKETVYELQKTLGDGLGRITSLAVTPNSKFIIAGSEAGSIKVFDFQTKQEFHHFQKAHASQQISLHSFSNHLNLIKSLKVTSDNKFIISASWNSINPLRTAYINIGIFKISIFEYQN